MTAQPLITPALGIESAALVIEALGAHASDLLLRAVNVLMATPVTEIGDTEQVQYLLDRHYSATYLAESIKEQVEVSNDSYN